MFRIISITAFIISFALILCGCSTVEIIDSGASEITPEMKKRAAEFKKDVATTCREFGVFIGKASRDYYKATPERIAYRCSLLGITDVYLEVDNSRLPGEADEDEEYAEITREFVSCFNARRIRPWIVLKDSALYSRPDKDWLDTLLPFFDSGEDSIYNKVENITDFNEDGAIKQDKVAGIIMLVSPHKLTRGAEDAPGDLLYSWSDTKYGKNNDNDMLMRHSFELIEAVKKYAGRVPVILMVEHFFHDKAAEGKLSVGNINDFIKQSDPVIVADFNTKPKEVRLQAEAELKAARKASSVIICMRVDADAVSGTVTEKAVNTKDWSYMLRVFKYIIRNSVRYRSFRGIALYDYAGFEKSWETGN